MEEDFVCDYQCSKCDLQGICGKQEEVEVANKMSLANKYRPQTFDDVCEQDSIKIVLENQIKNNNLKHAYLFCGGAGTRKNNIGQNYSKYDE